MSSFIYTLLVYIYNWGQDKSGVKTLEVNSHKGYSDLKMVNIWGGKK